MKRAWMEPSIEVQAFVANEYVANCFKGTCNISGAVYLEKDGNPGPDYITEEYWVWDGPFWGHNETRQVIDESTYKYTNDRCKHSFEITGIESASDLTNAYVIGRNGSVTPVYNFDNVHVATVDSIVADPNRPKHS